jgi:MFS family permease
MVRPVATSASATDMLLAALDSNITSTAIPPVVATLADLRLYGGVLAGDALSPTAATTLRDRISGVDGRTCLYLGGTVRFVLASAACVGSTSTLSLVVAGLGIIAAVGMTGWQKQATGTS